MQLRVLGRTGLRVTPISLGGGGFSKLGLARQAPREEAVKVVRHAIDAGINLIDSAECYGSEPVIGEALGSSRPSVVLATKVSPLRNGELRREKEFFEALENSLRNLRTDYIDIYQLHGVPPDHYPRIRDHYLPFLRRAREQGKIRFIGITEAFEGDKRHQMLRQALADDCWDTVMIGFNMLNSSARKYVFPLAEEKNPGVLGMFAIRRALTSEERTRACLEQLQHEGALQLPGGDPAAFFSLLKDAGCETIAEAGYRFCLSFPQIHTILSGTGSIDHLDANLRAIGKGPLPQDCVEQILALLGHVETVSGN